HQGIRTDAFLLGKSCKSFYKRLIQVDRNRLLFFAVAGTRFLGFGAFPPCPHFGAHGFAAFGHELFVELLRRFPELVGRHFPIRFFRRFAVHLFFLLRYRRFSRSVMGRAWMTNAVPSGSRTKITCKNRPPRPRPCTSNLSSPI